MCPTAVPAMPAGMPIITHVYVFVHMASFQSVACHFALHPCWQGLIIAAAPPHAAAPLPCPLCGPPNLSSCVAYFICGAPMPNVGPMTGIHQTRAGGRRRCHDHLGYHAQVCWPSHHADAISCGYHCLRADRAVLYAGCIIIIGGSHLPLQWPCHGWQQLLWA